MNMVSNNPRFSDILTMIHFVILKSVNRKSVTYPCLIKLLDPCGTFCLLRMFWYVLEYSHNLLEEINI